KRAASGRDRARPPSRGAGAGALARAGAVPAHPPAEMDPDRPAPLHPVSLRPGLTAVIPARDDAGPLARLLAQAAALRLFDRVVVVDDGSAVPLTPALAPPGSPPGWLEL